jgi:prepilin-type N-terminal cleavage/methylation domain-containing protein
MQISLTSRSRFFCTYRDNTQKGFTLIELLIVVSITALIATILVVRFSKFDGTVLLKSLAYEIASALREAQVYSLSVLGSSENFHTPYGMSFTPDSKSYEFFHYLGNTNDRPRKDDNASVLNTFTIGRSLEVYKICATANNTQNCDLTRLDISFRRPEFDALFYAVDQDGSSWEEGNISSAQVEVKSTDSNEVWVVNVSLLGQISVYRGSL